jgi:predicted PurR-regulated permease PerM
MSDNPVKTMKIEISLKSLLLILAVGAGAAFLFSIRNVLTMLFWAFILSSTLLPAIKKISEPKFISHGLSVAIVYISLILITIGLFTLVSVPLARETITLVEKFPSLLNQIASILNSLGEIIGLDQDLIQPIETKAALEQLSDNLTENFSTILSAGASGISGVFKFLAQVFGGVFNLLSVLTLSVYISIDHDNFMKALLKTIRKPSLKKDIKELVKKIENNLGNWISGKALLSFIVGAMSLVLLEIIGVQYAWPLSIFAMLMDSIPTIGATMAAIPAIVVALASGDILQIIGVPVGYVLIQQIENNYLAPTIMSTALGLPPIIIILAVLVGAQLGGILGILLAIPLAGVIHLTLEFWSSKAKNGKKD